jgi:hypothetical protein
MLVFCLGPGQLSLISANKHYVSPLQGYCYFFRKFHRVSLRYTLRCYVSGLRP